MDKMETAGYALAIWPNTEEPVYDPLGRFELRAGHELIDEIEIDKLYHLRTIGEYSITLLQVAYAGNGTREDNSNIKHYQG